ncbi:universal stress protein [Bacillus sp. B190/17]|uniref:Universal stress protein n=1 Tax=Bacillus lumedeiriae TaxID=3058829 RepID=A0ABW8I594_9BACI
MNMKYESILVAVDGSKEAEWAFQKSIEIAKRNNAVLNLIHVIDTRSYAALEAYERSISERAATYGADLLKKYKQTAEEAGVSTVNTYVEYGSPKIIIPKSAAKEVKADLIVCGATGLNAMERFLIGSVSEHIARSSNCDVLVVRTDKGE